MKHPVLRRVGAALAWLAGAGAVWAFFTFVIVDRAMFLDYVRVLVWPLLVGAVVLWMRDPLRDKLRELLRIEVPGGAAEFGLRLEKSITPEVDNLLGRNDGALAVADTVTPTDAQASDAESALGGAGPTESELANQAPAVGRELEPPTSVAKEPRSDVHAEAGIPVAFLLRLAQLMGASAEERGTIKSLLESRPSDYGVLILMLERLARRARPSPLANRRSIEGIIQKSASWGYDMASSGAAKVVPDVEWGDDGSWKITTEVPPSGPKRNSFETLAAIHRRQVKDLEDEIKKLERESHSLVGMRNPIEARELMAVLKGRLRRLDPANIWGIE